MSRHVARHGNHRLFVAVDPPRAVCEEVAAWGRAQRRGSPAFRVVEPGRIHLTLAFLGDRERGELDAIGGAMAAAVRESAPFAVDRLEVGAPLLLPPRHPRVLAVAVGDPDGTLGALQRALARALDDAIGWRDDRAFRPHLTVARLGRDAVLPPAIDPTPAATFAAEALVLYRSFLEPEGARYEELERAPFG